MDLVLEISDGDPDSYVIEVSDITMTDDEVLLHFPLRDMLILENLEWAMIPLGYGNYIIAGITNLPSNYRLTAYPFWKEK